MTRDPFVDHQLALLEAALPPDLRAPAKRAVLCFVRDSQLLVATLLADGVEANHVVQTLDEVITAFAGALADHLRRGDPCVDRQPPPRWRLLHRCGQMLDRHIADHLDSLERQMRTDIEQTGPDAESELDELPTESDWQRISVEEVLMLERQRLQHWKRQVLEVFV